MMTIGNPITSPARSVDSGPPGMNTSLPRVSDRPAEMMKAADRNATRLFEFRMAETLHRDGWPWKEEYVS